jgi:hypothetical protein
MKYANTLILASIAVAELAQAIRMRTSIRTSNCDEISGYYDRCAQSILADFDYADANNGMLRTIAAEEEMFGYPPVEELRCELTAEMQY